MIERWLLKAIQLSAALLKRRHHYDIVVLWSDHKFRDGVTILVPEGQPVQTTAYLLDEMQHINRLLVEAAQETLYQ